jgi:hypothetical protein
MKTAADDGGRKLFTRSRAKATNSSASTPGGPKKSYCRCAWTSFIGREVGVAKKFLKRDAQGRVVAMLDRRENNDLVWKKIK